MAEDLAIENELLLLQLHQLQEELEFYYLECKKLKSGQGVRVDKTENSGRSRIDSDGTSSLLGRLVSSRSSQAILSLQDRYVENSAKYQSALKRLSSLQKDHEELQEREKKIDAELTESRQKLDAQEQQISRLTRESEDALSKLSKYESEKKSASQDACQTPDRPG